MADEKKSVIIDLKFDVSEFKKNGAEAASTVKKLKDEQKLLTKSGQETSIKFQENAAEIKRLNAVVAENQKAVNNLTTANKANAGSNEQLKAQLSVMTLEYNKLSEAERVNSTRGKELFTQINQTTEKLKSNEKAVGDNRREVGNYEGALKSAAGGLQQFGGAAGGAASSVTSLGTKLMALLANPIVAIVAAIVGAFMALKKAFMSNEEGQDKLAKVTQVVSTIFGKLFDLIRPLANFLFDTLGKAFEYIGKEVDKVAKGIETSLRFLGFEDAANGVANYTSELKGAAKAAAAIAEARDKADEKERTAIVANAKANAEIAEARRISQDKENVSRADREAAIKRAVKLEDEVAGRSEEIAKLRFQALKAEQVQSSSTEEAKKELAEAEAKLFNIQQERSEGQKTLLRDLNKLSREENAEAKERQKEQQERLKQEIENNKKAIDLFILQQGTKAKSFEEELKLAEDVSAKKLAILETERKKKLITEQDYQIQSLQLIQELEVKKAQLLIDAASRELKLFIENNQSKLDNNQFLSDALYQQEIDRLNAVAEAQRSFEQKRLENGLITQQEYNDNINAINAENQSNNEALAADKKAADDEKKAIDLANQTELDFQRNENAFALQNEQLERAYQTELKAAEKTGADKALIEKRFTDYRKQLDLQQAQTTIGVAADTFGALASLAGDNAAAAKAFASFQAVMNATNSIISVLAATSTIPEPFGSVAKGIQAAAIGVTAFKNVQKINSTPVPKAAKGGVFGGQPHSNGGTRGYFEDGTQIEVERGELFAVVNKRNTSMLNYLSDLNSFGGNGKSFFASGGTKTFANGGIGFGNVSTSIDQSQSGIEQFMAAIENLPTPVVAVQDINEVQYSTNQVQVRANL